jgi:hypothetical protein
MIDEFRSENRSLGRLGCPWALLGNHGTPVTFHYRVVTSDQLCRHHAFKLVLWLNAFQSGEGGADLLVSCLMIGVLKPKRIDGLTGNNVVPVIRTRAAVFLKCSLLNVSIVHDHCIVHDDRRWRGLGHSLLSGLGFFAGHLPILSFSNATPARAEIPAAL